MYCPNWVLTCKTCILRKAEREHLVHECMALSNASVHFCLIWVFESEITPTTTKHLKHKSYLRSWDSFSIFLHCWDCISHRLTGCLKPWGECKVCREVKFPNSCSDSERLSMVMLCCRKTVTLRCSVSHEDMETVGGRTALDFIWISRSTVSQHHPHSFFWRKKNTFLGKRTTLVENERQKSSKYA